MKFRESKILFYGVAEHIQLLKCLLFAIPLALQVGTKNTAIKIFKILLLLYFLHPNFPP